MPRPRSVLPVYRFHKSSGQAVVTVPTAEGGRRDVYLGVYGSAESKDRYRGLLAELPAENNSGGRTAPRAPLAGITVAELLLAFIRHAEGYYRHPDGTPTGSAEEFKHAARPVRELYAKLPATMFGPLCLKQVRERIIATGLARSEVNRRVRNVRMMFRWAASEEMIPATVSDALGTVAGLRAGRTKAPDREPIKPAPQADVDAALAKAGPEIAAMIRVQRFTGMRPGELCRLRPCEIDRTGAVWFFRPFRHKNSHRGKPRVVAIGPRAQQVLADFEPPTPDDYFFSPRRIVEAAHAERSSKRATPRYPSHMKRNERKRAASPTRPPAGRYTSQSYARAVNRACLLAGVVPWSPNQLRHAAATQIRHRFGLEAAQAVLGHAKPDMTLIYAEGNAALAASVAVELG